MQVGKPMADLVAEVRRWVRIGLATTLLVLLVLAFAMRLVIRWTLRPVTRVQEAITARDALDLQPLPDERLPDEVRPLVESFNRLLCRLDGTMGVLVDGPTLRLQLGAGRLAVQVMRAASLSRPNRRRGCLIDRLDKSLRI